MNALKMIITICVVGTISVVSVFRKDAGRNVL
jgi:hypothetical protein